MNERTHKNLINEGAEGFVPTDPREAVSHSEIQALRDVWTLETTKNRRAEWNAYLANAKKAGRKVTIQEVEKEVGFYLADLKTAVVRHKLV